VASVVSALCVAATFGLGYLRGLPVAIVAALACVVGLACALALLHRCITRFGGITGDVLGALVETASAGALLVMAIR
jgi:adenosylcobinamide-GDP ribazoletransferase